METPPGRRRWDETAIPIAYRHGPRASELCTHVHAPRRRDHLRRTDCSACCARWTLSSAVSERAGFTIGNTYRHASDPRTGIAGRYDAAPAANRFAAPLASSAAAISVWGYGVPPLICL